MLQGAGRSVVNGEYTFDANAAPRHWCRRGQWKQIGGNCWIGFQDCGAVGNPGGDKWMVYENEAIVYAAHTGRRNDVDPREGAWEIATWAAEHQSQNIGEKPVPRCHYKSAATGSSAVSTFL